MCAADKPHTHFFEEMHKHKTLYFNGLTFLQELAISPILLGKLYEKRVAIKAILIKTTRGKPF